MRSHTYTDSQVQKRWSPPGHMRSLPNSYNPETRTITVSIGTGAPATRFSWSHGDWIEELDPAGANFERVDRGVCNVFKDHWPSVDKQLGRVVELSGRLVGGEILLDVRLTKAKSHEDVVNNIIDGTLQSTSFGYRWDDWEETPANPATGQVRKVLVKKFTIFEVSFVGIPADPGASSRGEDGEPSEPQAGQPGPQRANTMGDNTTTPGTSPAPTTPTDDTQKDEALIRAEQDRQKRLRDLGKRMGLDEKQIDSVCFDASLRTYPEAAAKLAELRAAEQDADPPASPPPMRTSYGATRNDHLLRGLTDALLLRAGVIKAPTKETTELVRGTSLAEIQRQCLEARGVDTRGMSIGGMLQRSLVVFRDSATGREYNMAHRSDAVPMHATTDFVSALEYTGVRIAQEAYDSEDLVFDQFSVERPLSSLKAHKLVRHGAFPSLTKAPQGGELVFGKIEDGGETYQACKYHAGIAVTEEVILEDDIGLLIDLFSDAGEATKSAQKDIVFALITANDGEGMEFSDGDNWFAAAHGNIASDAGVPTVDRIGALRLLLQSQLAIGSTTRYRSNPMVGLLVPEHYQTLCEKLLDSNYNGSTGAAPTPMQKLAVWHDPRLGVTGNKPWFGVAKRSGLVRGFLSGVPGPRVRTVVNERTLGAEIIADMYFGAGVRDWGGIAQNPYGLS